MTATELIGILAPLMQQERAGLVRRERYLQEEAESILKRIDYFDAALALEEDPGSRHLAGAGRGMVILPRAGRG